MATARKVLIADPDLTSARALTKALRARGYHVHYAGDGSRALELSVLRHPDVVLFDDQCQLIAAGSFAKILLSNPRTSDIPVVVTTRRSSEDPVRIREGYLSKPFNFDEVLARIDHLCQRAEAARDLRGDAREIEGGLSQLPLADLLQILSMNRRTGRLTLSAGRERGEISISDGRPANARLGDLEGEKALFRLIGWRDGTFAFAPGPPPIRSRINRSMEDALLEGMRQVDERQRLLATLPPLGQVLALSPEASLPVDPHPVTAEVLRVLAQPRRLSEVLDRADAPDLEILGALGALLHRGVLERHDSATASEGPLLSTAEVHALKSRLTRGSPNRHTLVAKILVCGSGSRAGRWLLKGLPGLEPPAPNPSCLRSGFGTLGRLEVSDVLQLDFLFVPTTAAARPLWRPFSNSALGVLVVEASDDSLRLARFCAFELRLPVVIASRTASNGLLTSDLVPAVLRGAPAGTTVVSSDIGSAVRAVLVSAMHGQAGEPHESAVSRPRPG